MTTQERIAMMNGTIEREAHEEMEKAMQKENLRIEMIWKVQALADRIKPLIELGEAVRKKNAMPRIDPLYEKNNMDKVFVANGWSHRVGFMGRLNVPITYIGFYAGGANGPWDFYTDGEEVFVQHQDTKQEMSPSIGDLGMFFDEFEDFERRFYAWFDKRFGQEG